MKRSTCRLACSMMALVLTAIQVVGQSVYTPYTFTTSAGVPGLGGTGETGSTGGFNSPQGVAADSAGNVYVADTLNHTIRQVTPTGVVTTLAGLAGSVGFADGAGSDARFFEPSGVAMDAAGNVYVADKGNSTLRKVTPAGVVTTLGGLAGSYGSADGIGSAARFGSLPPGGDGPIGVAVDSAGNVYIADTSHNTIRKGYPAPWLLQFGPGFGFNPDGSGFGFTLWGPAGQLAVVEASTDMVNWLPLGTNTLGTAPHFSDAQSAAHSNRFYRARLP